MSTSIVFRVALPGLALLVAAGAAHAEAAQDCQDSTLVPTEQRAACTEAVEATTDPLEQARLLVLRAGTYRREQNVDMIEEDLADLAEAERLAPEMDPQLRADLLVERAGVLSYQGNHEAALAAIEEAERLAPDDADPLVARGVDLANQGDLEGALAQLARARELDPDNLDAHVWSMFYLYDAGDLEACVESGNRAVEIGPLDARTWTGRGICLAELGRAEEALSDLKEAERLGPYVMTDFEGIGFAYLALDRPEDVLAVARRAVEMDPMDEVAQSLLTVGLIETDQLDEAIAAYEAAEAAGVEDTTGVRSNNIAWGLYMGGKHEQALPIIAESLAGRTDPAAGDVDTHAHILAALGRTDEAVQTFLRAAELGGPEIRSMYEEALTALGHTPEPSDEGFEAALRACVATGEACKLVPQ